MTQCVDFFGVCLTRPSAPSGADVFGFPEFLTALALLVLAFNATEQRYRFRLKVSVLPVKGIALAAAVVAGLGTLLTDLGFAERWSAPALGVTRAEIQTALAVPVLASLFLWARVAYFRPARFSRWNAARWHSAILHATVGGSEDELRAVALELPWSAEALCGASAAPIRSLRRRGAATGDPGRATHADYADEILRMLGNRRLCRIVAVEVPTAAMSLMMAARDAATAPPLGDFARNVTEEALRHRDSILYHEDPIRAADYVGTAQPFENAMFGSYRLVEALASGRWSPFDVHWRLRRSLDEEQLEALARGLLATISDYVGSGRYGDHSYALARAIGGFESDLLSVGELDGMASGITDARPYAVLAVAVRLVSDVLELLDGASADVVAFEAGRHREIGRKTLLDAMVSLAFEAIHGSGYVRSPRWTNWSIQHNAVWGPMTNFRKGTPVWDLFQRRLYRALYDEIREMERWPNFKGARILGFVLNVLGIDPDAVAGMDRRTAAFKRVVIRWTRRHYVRMTSTNPQVAEYVLTGGIAYSSTDRRFEKTYAQGTAKEPSREFLDLDCGPGAGAEAPVD